MEKRKKALNSLIETIKVLELEKADYVSFVRRLLAELNLSVADCFSEEMMACMLKLKKKNDDFLDSEIKNTINEIVMQPSVKENEVSLNAKQELEQEVADETAKPQVEKKQTDDAPKIRKGYSRNGKKLGRPRKDSGLPVFVSDDLSNSESEDNAGKENEVTPLSSEVAPDEKEPPVETDEYTLTEAEKAELEKLKMGKEFSTEILYQWHNKFVLSNRVLQEANPLGVVVPYVCLSGEYKNFILYYKNEISGLSVETAKKYAQNKLPQYKGQKWNVLDSWQIKSVAPLKKDINEILKKIGGEPFEGDYMTVGSIYYRNHKYPEKIRYAVNIK